MPQTREPTSDPDSSGNPFLSRTFRIPFHEMEALHVAPAVKAALARAEEEVAALADDPGPRTWSSTLQRLDDIGERVNRVITPIQHLLSVAETPELREAYNGVLPEITRFWSRLSLHQGLWQVVEAFAATPEAAELDPLRARHLEKTRREFRRAGAHLPPQRRDEVEELRVRLSQLQQRFSENVLDATAAYQLHLLDEGRLGGIPEGPRNRFRQRAREEGKEGWIVTLDYPAFEAVMKHALHRGLREEVYLAFVGRCRDGEWGNRGLVVEILELRRKLATALGYPDFPDYRLEEAMARSGAQARTFVEDLTTRTRPYWERDLRELQAHALALGLDRLRPWDVAFVAENLRRERYEVDDELLRPYFPLPRVLDGLFQVARQVFGLEIREVEVAEVWHSDVRYYEVRDGEGTFLGGFYTDWFPRKEKRQGAWMHDFISGGPVEGGEFRPNLGFIAGNFTPPDGQTPALLTHREVETTFHEFGHLLHHCVSRVPLPARGGLNVAWDWVELPSQIMENWCWEKEALTLFSGHHVTGEPLPPDLFQRLHRARRFMGGWAQMRQLSFATLDLALHQTFTSSDPEALDDFVTEVLLPFSPDEEFASMNIVPTFSHLFAGGYAAGYYSYLWSEVLDADAFTRFQEEGIFNRDTGEAFVSAILGAGDRDDPEQLFREFMGRDPDPQALLERNLGSLGSG